MWNSDNPIWLIQISLYITLKWHVSTFNSNFVFIFVVVSKIKHVNYDLEMKDWLVWVEGGTKWACDFLDGDKRVL